MTSTLSILHSIWERSERGFVFLPFSDASGGWHEPNGERPEGLVEDGEFPGAGNRFFTPGTFKDGDMRLAESHADLGVLYADLDDKYDRDLLARVPPSVWWETSPGMEQAVWFLDKPYPWREAIEWNRALSVALGADHGSWIPTKLLRIPGTWNWKRQAEGRLLVYAPERVYDPAELLAAVDAEAAGPYDKQWDGDFVIPTPREWITHLHKWWPRIDHRTKGMLHTAQVSDRSLHLARIAKSLATIRMNPQEIFTTLWFLPTNKFEKRPEQLWNSVVLTAFD